MKMKIRAIVVGMVAGLILPVVGANAQTVFDPVLNAAGAGADLERGVAPTAENFGRSENDGKDKGDKDKGDHRCDDGDHSDKGHKNEECEKSKGKDK